MFVCGDNTPHTHTYIFGSDFGKANEDISTRTFPRGPLSHDTVNKLKEGDTTPRWIQQERAHRMNLSLFAFDSDVRPLRCLVCLVLQSNEKKQFLITKLVCTDPIRSAVMGAVGRFATSEAFLRHPCRHAYPLPASLCAGALTRPSINGHRIKAQKPEPALWWFDHRNQTNRANQKRNPVPNSIDAATVNCCQLDVYVNGNDPSESAQMVRK